MDIEDRHINNFIKEFSCTFSVNCFKKKDISSINKIPLNQKECVYLLDHVQNKISYNRGFHNVLGYSDNEIDIDFIKNNHHPDDSEMVNKIFKATIMYCLKNTDNVLNNVLFISYRRKKKDGSYIKVLSEFCFYEINDEGIPTMGLVKITDISFMDTSDVVNWSFQSTNLNKEAFKEQIYKVNNDFFTKREKEIIVEIRKGNTSNQIAKKLMISKHTVSTHRKNIFKKSNKHTTLDLILFCKRKGIV